ncbi:hypothetical protein [Bradyrhizobium australafricanum]|uniref:hypothetical protein n=1 Tax=Bradyrhizobium australafricanum TaxID=2821406 RepID=UPI001CE2D60B|nr:hypothetical protein [Bradyrhizobium australafricanum]MCA6098173.1 hypothetical protein [Bradyrhizobium australafricanum]
MSGQKAMCPGCGAEAGVSVGYRVAGDRPTTIVESNFICNHSDECPKKFKPSPCVVILDEAMGVVQIAGKGNERWFDNEYTQRAAEIA